MLKPVEPDSEDLKVGDTLSVTIALNDPESGEGRRLQTFSVPYTRQMRILEALDYIVEELGESLAYQWFCGVKKCGMCGVMMNGRQKLACWEPVEREMVIEPLDGFPVVRDLVIDRSGYQQNLASLRPWMQRREDYTSFPEAIDGDQLAPAAEMMHCIECMLCVSACPANGDDFMGPAPMVQLARFALDPRDDGNRAAAALDPGGIEHCVGCYQCSRVCPTGIPVFEMAIGGLRNKVREAELESARTPRSRFFASVHDIGRTGSRLAGAVNRAGKNPTIRGLVEKALGIDRRRTLPEFAAMPFEQWFGQRPKRSGGDRRVVLFHDTFVSYFEPEIGKAATGFFEACGYEVALAEGRKCCGRPMLSEGREEAARKGAAHNLELLKRHADQGMPVVGLEPSCVLTIRNDYPKLLAGDDDVERIVANVLTFEEFVAGEAAAGRIKPEWKAPPEAVLLHGHCHQKAMIGTAPALEALALTGAGSVQEIPTTCCGMAGSNGYECEHYERSVEAAEVRLLPAVRDASDATLIAAAGTSCRQQIMNGTGRRALHPAEILYAAVGGGSE